MQRFFAFILVFAALFGLTVGFFALVDALPEQAQSEETPYDPGPMVPPSTLPGAEAPLRVVARDAGVDVKINNPSSTDLKVLDDSLLTGAVRYPTSAQLGESGTVLLFGHSSHLPIVHNQYYKAFNGIEKLESGDTISVYSAGYEYRYTVVGVRFANAQEDIVELPSDGKYLTLVTCDNFSTKSSRFVVTADFVAAYP